MNKILEYSIIAVTAFIVAVLGIGKIPQIAVISVLSAAGIYFIRKIPEQHIRKTVTFLFFVTFILQIIVSLFLYNETVETKYYGFSYKGDDYVYGDFGTIVSNLWRKGIFPTMRELRRYNLIGSKVEIQPYQFYNVFIFYLFGACAGQILLIINCFLHAFIIVPVYYICRALNIQRSVVIFILSLFLFWPSTFYWSLFNFREPMMLFILIMIFMVCILFEEKRSLKHAVFLLSLLLLLSWLKNHLIILFPAAILYLIFLRGWKNKKFIILIFILFLIALQLKAGCFSNLYSRLKDVPLALFNIRHSSRFSNTSYSLYFLTYTYPRTLLYLPFGLIESFFLPFILRPASLFQIAVNIESIFWWSFTPFLIGGIWISIRKELRKTFIAVVTFFFWISILALTQGNMGTLLKQKSIIYYIGFIFIGLGIDRALRKIQKL